MIQVFDCEQNSPEWYAARLGIPTASMFSAILAKGEGKTRASYMRQLAAEIVTGEPGESFSSQAMERGKAMEEEARRLYEFITDEPMEKVGFIRNGDKGASPDSLVGPKGGVEIKTQRADLLISTLLADKFPAEHTAQVQGTLWVAEREWWDLIVFWPKMPLFRKRVYRDDKYIKELEAAVSLFNEELAQLVDKIRTYGAVAA